MSLTIPTASAQPLYQQVTTLDGKDYLLTFAFNGRDGHWYLDIADQDGVLIVPGLALVVSWDLLHRCQDPRRPPGVLACEDLTDQGLDPGRDDLGTRVRLIYLPTT